MGLAGLLLLDRSRRVRRVRAARARRGEPAPLTVDSLSVVLPAYNTGAAIADTVAGVRVALGDLLAHPDSQIIVVDDASNEVSGTREAARASGATLLTHLVNQGKGAAVRTGLAASRATAMAFTDGDGAYDPALLVEFARALEHADLVIGVRRRGHDDGRAGLRALASRLFHLVTRLALVDAREDTQAGIKMMRADAAAQFVELGVVNRFSFDVELLAIAEARGWVVAEVPVSPRGTAISTVRVSAQSLGVLGGLLGVALMSRLGLYA